MAEQYPSPIVDWIADGRLQIRERRHFNNVRIHLVDLEEMHASLVHWFQLAFANNDKITGYYDGTLAERRESVTGDIAVLADYCLGLAYNKLRSIMERYAPASRSSYMNTKCPIHSQVEVPLFAASALSSIGAFRVNDTAVDCFIIYSSSATRATNYGRANAPNFIEGNYRRLINAIKSAGYPVGQFNWNIQENATYYPSIRRYTTDGRVSLIGIYHQSHYCNDDVARFLFTNADGHICFETSPFTAERITDTATLAALAAIAAPAGIPAGQTADSPPRVIHGAFNVNYFGLTPAAAATQTREAVPRSAWIIGRGTTQYYTCLIANDLATNEIDRLMLHLLLEKK